MEWLAVSFLHFICLSAVSVEWQYSCFATNLLRHPSPQMTTALVLFVIFEKFVSWLVYRWVFMGFLLPFRWSFLLLSYQFATSCSKSMTQEVIDCGHEHTLLLSSFSFRAMWMSLEQKTNNCTQTLVDNNNDRYYFSIANLFALTKFCLYFCFVDCSEIIANYLIPRTSICMWILKVSSFL